MDNVKKLKIKPLYVIIGIGAVVAGIFLVGKMKGGSTADQASATPTPTVIEHPVTSIDDLQQVEELKKRLDELERGPAGDNRYPPIGSKPPSGAPTPAPAPAPRPAPIPAITPKIAAFSSTPSGPITTSGQYTWTWNIIGVERATLSGGAAGQTVNVPVKGSIISKPGRAGTFIWTLTGYDKAGKPVVKQDMQRTVNPAPRVDQPKPVPAPQSNANIPGGYADSCNGVSAPPPDDPGRDVVRWINSSTNPAQRAGKALAWAIVGQQTLLTGEAKQARDYLAKEANWPNINRVRRTRGLRPLSTAAFRSLASELAAAYSGRESFRTDFLQRLWDTYRLPYLCGGR